MLGGNQHNVQDVDNEPRTWATTLFIVVGLSLIFFPTTCTCGTCTQLYYVRAVLGASILYFVVKANRTDSVVSEEAPESVLRICPHCGEKTLKKRPACVNCGKSQVL